MGKPLLEWEEIHRIGVDFLDFEHQNLFRSISELADELERGESDEDIEACLGEIHARMLAHFALEEKFMRDKKYVGIGDHKAKHDNFVDEFGDLMADFDSGDRAVFSDEVRQHLKQWIEDHVLEDDKRMISAVS